MRARACAGGHVELSGVNARDGWASSVSTNNNRMYDSSIQCLCYNSLAVAVFVAVIVAVIIIRPTP